MTPPPRTFVKDLHRLWPEIILSLLMLLVFCITGRPAWSPRLHTSGEVDISADIVAFLLIFTWWLLIARAVYADSPISPRKLPPVPAPPSPGLSFRSEAKDSAVASALAVLAAKLLFLLTFVAIPFVLAQLFLLHNAALSITSNLTALTLNLLVIAIALWLPPFVLASVIPNFKGLVLTLLAAALILWEAARLHARHLPVDFEPHPFPLWFAAIPAAVCLGVLLMQYTRQATTLSRAILVALAIALIAATALRDQAASTHSAYTELAPNEAPPFTIAVDPHPTPAVSDLETFPPNPALDEIFPEPEISTLHIPIIITVAPNHAVRVDEVTSALSPLPSRIDTLKASGPLLPGAQAGSLSPFMGFPYARFKDQPLTVSLTLFVTESEALDTETVTLARELAVPGGGLCRMPLPSNSDFDDREFDTRDPFDLCRYPLGKPGYTLVTGHWSDQPCTQPSTSGATGHAWIGEDPHGTFDFSLNPIHYTKIWLDHKQHHPGTQPSFLCPGTAATFTRYRPTRRRVLHLTLPPILPRDYTKSREASIDHTFSIR